jgi:hypothetical protein
MVLPPFIKELTLRAMEEQPLRVGPMGEQANNQEEKGTFMS